MASESDADLICQELSRGGYPVVPDRVEDATSMNAALSRQAWDLVVAEAMTPTFNAYDALLLVKKRGLDIPFIVVSAGEWESVAVATMKAGANDYLLKADLQRLLTVVRRELRENPTRSARREAEQALRRADELAARLDKVLDTSSNEIYFFDADSLRFLRVSQGAARNLGYTKEEMLQLTPLDLKPEYPAERFLPLVEELRTGLRDQVVFETTHRRKDGSTYAVEVRLQLTSTEDPPVFVEISQDITDRRAAADKLAERARQQAALAEVSQAALTTRTRDEFLALATRLLAETLGLERAHVWEHVPAAGALVLRAGHGWKPDQVGRATVATDGGYLIGYVLDKRRPVAIEDARSEKRFKVASARTTLAALATAIPGSARPYGVLGCHGDSPRRFSADDVAFIQALANVIAAGLEDKRATEALRDSEERYRQLIENVKDYAICALDARGNVASWNAGAARLFRRSEAESVGEYLATFYPPEDRGRGAPERALSTATATGRHEEEGWRARPDGSRFWAVTVLTAIANDEGALVGFSLLTRDLTERRRAEEELDASRRQLAVSEKLSALGSLVSGVAHEVRTPLTYLTNNLFLLEYRLNKAVAANPALAELQQTLSGYTRAALEGVERVQHLVNNLRRSSRVDPGRRTRLPLHEVVSEAVELFQITHRGRVELKNDLAPTSEVEIDKEQIQQVAINLLVNAAEAMPQGGTVKVATRDGAAGPEFVVADEGPGLTPEIEARMFDPFFTTKREGTGLGLSISKRIVEAHGGGIHYETRPGQGTEFRVRLPRVA